MRRELIAEQRSPHVALAQRIEHTTERIALTSYRGPAAMGILVDFLRCTGRAAGVHIANVDARNIVLAEASPELAVWLGGALSIHDSLAVEQLCADVVEQIFTFLVISSDKCSPAEQNALSANLTYRLAINE